MANLIAHYNVIIIGAGAAGLFCAIEAGKRGRSVAVLDHAGIIGRKIMISGGGRCNFTNTQVSADNYLSANPHFVKSALSRFTPDYFITLVEKHGISYYEKKPGQLFCVGKSSAQNIVNMLLKECDDAGVEVHSACTVNKIQRDENSKQGGFALETTLGNAGCESVVIATGGLSIPTIGATGFGYDIARQFNVNTIATRPALGGFTFDNVFLDQWAELSGLSIECLVTVDRRTFRENVLFTHMGFSGPAILQVSLYWTEGSAVTIDWLPGVAVADWLETKRSSQGQRKMHTILSELWPKRFAEKFCQTTGFDQALASFSEKRLTKLEQQIHHWAVTPTGTVGYDKAEVTAGGVDTNELSSKTMEVKKAPGLYFIGEVVDVTGWLGGYNFQWAWASGYVAGQYV
ncbi:NAD(P)/FAD-dependent oxidoreductase [Planctomycetota bacterium]